MNLLRGLRFAARTLQRTPGPALIAVLALGVGIGLSTLMFSLTQATMLRGLPFEEPDDLVVLTRVNRTGGESMPLIHDYAARVEGARSFERLGAFLTGAINLSGGADDVPQRVRGARVTSSTLRLLGVRPVAGRLLEDGDDLEGAPPVILIGAQVWRGRFGSDPGVVGRTVSLCSCPPSLCSRAACPVSGPPASTRSSRCAPSNRPFAAARPPGMPPPCLRYADRTLVLTVGHPQPNFALQSSLVAIGYPPEIPCTQSCVGSHAHPCSRSSPRSRSRSALPARRSSSP